MYSCSVFLFIYSYIGVIMVSIDLIIALLFYVCSIFIVYFILCTIDQ